MAAGAAGSHVATAKRGCELPENRGVRGWTLWAAFLPWTPPHLQPRPRDLQSREPGSSVGWTSPWDLGSRNSLDPGSCSLIG